MDDTPNLRTFIPTIVVSIMLCLGVYVAFQSAKNTPSTIVLPGGITYLGPTPTPITSPTFASYKGKLYPYTFSYPASFSLGWFPDDPLDAVTAFIDKTDSNQNIFFRVETVKQSPMDHASNWWKDYAWKDVESVTAFTNSMGLHGYRAKYIDNKGVVPFDHVFFEVPERNDLIIWVSGKLFSQEVFDKLVDSVSWKSN